VVQIHQAHFEEPKRGEKMEGMQPDESTQEVSWEVRWKSPMAADGTTVVVRRDKLVATVMARTQRQAGFETKLLRVEKTEIDF
jgi:hypothetical protein